MATHKLELTADTLHGDFSPNREPVLRIKAGDVVESSCLDANWFTEEPPIDGSPDPHHPKYATLAMKGHAMTGPIYIEGAEVGKTLEVTYEALTVGAFGWIHAGGFPYRVNEAFDLVDKKKLRTLWDLDAENLIGTDHLGHKVKLSPFLGNMGMPPPEDGNHSTSPPSNWGGNLDCKELVVGTKLYLPIPVEGGLFSFGDGHALQGHGEVSITAIECPMEYVRLKLDVIDDMPLKRPRAWTPAGWITFGFAENLDDATYMALGDMLDFMVEKFDLPDRQHALGLASAVVDVHITQIANPLVGAHAFLPHDAFID